MPTSNKKLPPCPCGQPAIKKESNVSVCARCHKIETRLNGVRNRDRAGIASGGLTPYTMFTDNYKKGVPRYDS